MKAYAWVKLKQWFDSETPEELEIYLVPVNYADTNYGDIQRVMPNSAMFESCIKAIANREYSFKIIVSDKFNKTQSESYCEILDRRIYNKEFVDQYRIKQTLDLTNSSQVPIYVCGRNTNCHRNKHNITTVRAKVLNYKKTRTVDIIVSKCLDKSHTEQPYLFIFYEELKTYEKKYGTLLFNHIPDKSLTTEGNDYERSLFHKMALNGYSVAKSNNLSIEERHELLEYFIDNNIVTYNEMSSHFEYLINQGWNNPNQQDAVYKWQSDWNYIKEYLCEKDEYWAAVLRW